MDAEIPVDFETGLHPIVKDWLFNSKSPAAETWRRTIKERWAWETEMARKRQAIIHEQAKHTPPADPKKKMRIVATVDPVIAANYRRVYGSACLNDPAFIKDCRKTAPELFVDGK